jgi:hypothetical protein
VRRVLVDDEERGAGGESGGDLGRPDAGARPDNSRADDTPAAGEHVQQGTVGCRRRHGERPLDERRCLHGS